MAALPTNLAVSPRACVWAACVLAHTVQCARRHPGLAHQGPQTTAGSGLYDEAAAAATRARASSS